MAHELRDEEMDQDDLSQDSDEEEQTDFPVVMILMTGLWTMLYAVFSFGFNVDPSSCIVSNK